MGMGGSGVKIQERTIAEGPDRGKARRYCLPPCHACASINQHPELRNWTTMTMTPTTIAAPAPWTPEQIQEQNLRFYEIYAREAAAIRARHAAQTVPEAAALRNKYQKPVFR